MKRRVLLIAAIAASFLCGCEDAAQNRALDADIERARAQIGTRIEEKQRIEAELRKLDRLAPEHAKLQAQVQSLTAERQKLQQQLRKEPTK